MLDAPAEIMQVNTPGAIFLPSTTFHNTSQAQAHFRPSARCRSVNINTQQITHLFYRVCENVGVYF
jgi:hypothetical protein